MKNVRNRARLAGKVNQKISPAGDSLSSLGSRFVNLQGCKDFNVNGVIIDRQLQMFLSSNFVNNQEHLHGRAVSETIILAHAV
jgi:hypothetical protein